MLTRMWRVFVTRRQALIETRSQSLTAMYGQGLGEIRSQRLLGITLVLGGMACSVDLSTEPQHLQIQQLQQQCDADDTFAWIPAGEFIYGSDRAERDYAYQISALAIAQAPGENAQAPGENAQAPGENAQAPNRIAQAEQGLRQRQWFDREPQRQVRSLPGFCIQTNLVTNEDYYQFVQMTGHRAPDISEADYQMQGFLVHPYETVEHYRWRDQRYPNRTDDHPVVLVSYTDALMYAQWKGEQDQVRYRLPTAEEWEKTARGPDGHYFPWGNEWVDEATNWAKTYQIAAVPTDQVLLQEPGATAIATFPLSQSQYGVNDMAGNVFEYTSTLRDRNGKTRSVMKGCSWDDWPGFCRAAYEHTRPIESRHILFGFRLIKEFR